MTEHAQTDSIAHLRASTDPGVKLLIAEIDRNRTALKRTWKWGVILSASLAVYFAWLVAQVRTVVFDPMTLGAAAAAAVDHAVPEMLSRVETAVTANPGAVARKATDAIAMLIKVSSTKAEKQIKQIPSVIAQAREPFLNEFRALAAEHGDEVRELYRSGKSDQEIADHIVQLALEGAVTGLDSYLKMQADAGLPEFSAAALAAIERADAHLAYLTSVPQWKMTKKDALQRRTLAAWTHVVENKLD